MLHEQSDTYRTLSTPAEGSHSQLRSKFLAFAYPVQTEAEAMAHVARLKDKYYDARHVCWAYRLTPTGEVYRLQDDGEPSGTAGKPIYGAILSAELTEIIVLVVRYFGGVKLGTSGLIEAYRTAANDSLERATIVEKVLHSHLEISYGYDLMGDVMRIVKAMGAQVLEQDFREHCRLRLSIRQRDAVALTTRLTELYGVKLL